MLIITTDTKKVHYVVQTEKKFILGIYLQSSFSEYNPVYLNL